MALIRRTEAAGYSAMVVMVDAPINGVRNRAQRVGYVLPRHVRTANLSDAPTLP